MPDGTKTINLALQGGGAHGAFTWGVLEHLLQDARFDFKTISGTSAGAMNGAVLAYGLLQGDRANAALLLEKFWYGVSKAGRFGIFSTPNAIEQFMGPMRRMAAGAYAGFDIMSRMISPYQFNPLDYNPLKDILLDIVDFEALRKSEHYQLHISATDVLRGRLKNFTTSEISVDVILASACLPHLFQAVKIGEHYYWDGGYMGNPSLYPMTRCQATQDIVIVQIDPVSRSALPKKAEDIADRVNEISFNSPLVAELRGIHFVNRLLEKGHIRDESGLRPLHLHVISDAKTMAALPLDSKFNPEWEFLKSLRDVGRAAGKKWVEENYEAVGKRGTMSLDHLAGG
jgi:NTE family protein